MTKADVSESSKNGGGVAAIGGKAGKYLTFKLAHEEYGLEILKVQEIISMMEVTHLPSMPDFIRGVINLRGKIIPIIDLRLKFGMEAQAAHDRTSIIVVRLTNVSQGMVMGIIVDEVSEVSDLTEGQLDPPPSFGHNLKTDFILAMGKVGNKVLTMLDIDRVFSEMEIETVASVADVKPIT